MNKEKLFRLYREEDLSVRRRRSRKRATGTRAPMALPDGPNQRWSLDFVSDALSWGRRLQILCIVDDYTREALALVVDTLIGGRRLARELDAIIARRGKPVMIVSDNGTEMTSRAILDWVNRTGVGWHYELGLQLGKQTLKRRVRAKLRDDRQTATQPNETWAMDFVHDQLATGKKIRVLTVIDTFSRFVPIVDPRFSYRAEDVVMSLERTCAEIGYTKTIRVDQGSEFI